MQAMQELHTVFRIYCSDKKVPVSFRAIELPNIVQQDFLCSQSRGQEIIWVIFVGKVAKKNP